ncbi:hypothetical protein PAMP_023087 [Pampus punctatissimus]
MEQRCADDYWDRPMNSSLCDHWQVLCGAYRPPVALTGGYVGISAGSTCTIMGSKKLAIFLLVLCLCLEGGSAKEKGTKKGKKKGKQVYCPSQLSSEDLARVPANSTSNILNRNSCGRQSKHFHQQLWLNPRNDYVGYTTDDLQFMWQTGDPVQMDAIALPQFDIRQEDIDYGNCTKYYAGTGYYTCVEVIFTLRRQVGFYMMGVYAPTLLIVVLSWLSFWINPDASAARVPLGILSVLSLSSECTSLASELPKVSYVKAIDIWLIACLLFGFASLVEYAVVQVMLNSPKRIEAEKAKIASKEKAVGKSPAAKNNTVNGTGGTPLHVSTLHVAETRCKKVCTSKSDLRTNDFSIVGSLPRDFELSNFDCYGKPIDTGSGHGKSQAKNNKKPPPPKPVIPSAAKRVDLYARALFPFSFLFFNVIYWSIYL